tara:strand:- start:194 stop:394 length:201 start_codon:yes stop_codon:yes gene_type:complete
MELIYKLLSPLLVGLIGCSTVLGGEDRVKVNGGVVVEISPEEAEKLRMNEQAERAAVDYLRLHGLK